MLEAIGYEIEIQCGLSLSIDPGPRQVTGSAGVISCARAAATVSVLSILPKVVFNVAAANYLI